MTSPWFSTHSEAQNVSAVKTKHKAGLSQIPVSVTVTVSFAKFTKSDHRVRNDY